MAVPVSFVIPVLNEAKQIEPLLNELRVRFSAAQVLIVDGGSTDHTVELARAQACQVLNSPPGRALQMNCGGAVASGDYLFFLHADSVPGLDADRLESYLERGPQWGFCRVRLSGKGMAFRVIEWFINHRSALTRVATGDQMLFVRRELFAASGGFDVIPLMEDVAYSKRLREVASPLIVSEPVHTSSRRWEERGIVRTVLQMWGLRLAYWLGRFAGAVAAHLLWLSDRRRFWLCSFRGSRFPAR